MKVIQDGFTIVGGGTAGFLAALFLNKKYPEYNVSLIHSKQIGILGAGEGTTPHLVTFIEQELNISVFQLFKNTNATLKNGIKFTNWNKHPGSYFHGFANIGDTEFLQDPFFFKRLAYENKSYDDYSVANQLSVNLKSPFIEKATFNILSRKAVDNCDSNIFRDLAKQSINFAVHFDAVELANYLEKIAVERGINVIDDKVTDIITDDNNYITEINTENNGRHKTKYVIDSTGFARLIIGKKYNTEWISRKDYLPMKEAQPFFLPQEDLEKVEPSTESIAQDAGWIWKIPLQHRYGCGYVYDSDYITNQQVREKILEIYPSAEMGKKTFKFEAGYYKDTAVKNCFGAGLASSFVEPLEATSIFMFVEQLRFAFDNGLFQAAISRDKNSTVFNSIKNKVNEFCRSSNEDVCEFIQYHYLADKDETPFWREFRQKNKLFDNVIARIDMLSNGILDTQCTQTCYTMFDQPSYLVVGSGLGFLKVETIEDTSHNLEDIRLSLKEYTERHLTHTQLIINNQDWVIC